MTNYPLVPIDSCIFRAYDIRGIVPEHINPQVFYQLGRALGSTALERNISTLNIGADARLSSPKLKQALSQGILATGCNLIDNGCIPTPFLAFATHQAPDKSGVMITASHNPKQYNGCKITLAGLPLSDTEIQQLKQRIEKQDYINGNGTLSTQDILPIYQQSLSDNIKLEKPLKIVLDCANAIAGKTAPALFEQLGCEVIALHCSVDGNFPNHCPDPSRTENLTDLIQQVQLHKADLGIALDGDADRFWLVSSTGEIIFPDRIMLLFIEETLKQQQTRPILYDIKCSQLLPNLVKKMGGSSEICKTGHSFMKAKMQETQAIIGCEMSGHFYFNDVPFHDDGIYAAARLLQLLSQMKESISQLCNKFPQLYSTAELQIAVTEQNKFALIREIQTKAFVTKQCTYLDGVRVDYKDGWGLIRASNTLPILVLRFEAETKSALKRIRTDFQQRLTLVDKSLLIPEL